MGLQAAGPMEQFEIVPIVPLSFGGLDISFTNSSLWMLIGTTAIAVFFFAATRRAGLVPGRLQSAAEVMYEFVADLVRDTIGAEGRKFFPYVFTLFLWILVANLFGLLPSFPRSPQALHVFTPTSHLIVTLALAMLTISIVIVYGFWKNGLKFLKLFWPSGLPWPMYAIIPLIEVISFLSRPLSLAIRLFANMFAGHIILKLFAGFVVSLLAAEGAIKLFGLAPFLGAVAVTALEFLVAALQAYVFAVLTCIYLSDAAHAADH
ncbi:F0F1 ATP synthase subunit A [Hyphococcus luteus]|uniref:ATP synthase subunit a n=1 Tax=Hyphococcus luteus TaxID=2058213 RepID=A0A2S7K5J7_9PROT|nr:F0F1 ATP synthase subunit A [Marinicaulis flavus]